MTQYIKAPNGKQYPLRYAYRAQKMLREYLRTTGKTAEDLDIDELAYFVLFAGCKAEGEKVDFEQETIIEWIDQNPSFGQELQITVNAMIIASTVQPEDADITDIEEVEEAKKKPNNPKKKKPASAKIRSMKSI